MRNGNGNGGGREGGGRDGGSRGGRGGNGGGGGRSMRGGRGGGRGGRGGFGGGGGGGGRGGRGRGGRGRRRDGGGGGGRGDLLRSAESGNRRERIAVESGFLVLIDQFMLANPQFIAQLSLIVDEAPEKKDDLIAKFGGAVVEVEPGTYRIDRDPFAVSIVIHQEGYEPDINELAELKSDKMGTLFVDTRCLAMIDRELLDDTALLDKYQEQWFAGQDKACRDLIRDNGGAVRYGFNRNGDELLVSRITDDNVVCLWPTTGPVLQPQPGNVMSAEERAAEEAAAQDEAATEGESAEY